MNTVLTVLMVILIILIIGLGVMYYLGRKMVKQQEAQAPMIEANTQIVTMLVVDKKKMSLKDAVAAGLPEAVESQTPFYLRWSKLPVVKAKVGARMMTLMADPAVFDQIPTKKECKFAISGIYIREIKAVRGGIVPRPVKKKGFLEKLREKAGEAAGKKG